ncbi:hypothetical protein GCM10017776_59840 [Streptomyces griseoluteus]|nr:hypothetical protein GCM10017776_59840 [Streptomyces griseoluteus]
MLLFSEGVAAQWLERDRGQLATQAGYAGIHGASSLVPSPYGWLGSAGQENPFPQEREAGSAEHLAFEHLDPVDVSFDDAGKTGTARAVHDALLLTGDEPFVTLMVNAEAGDGKVHALYR